MCVASSARRLGSVVRVLITVVLLGAGTACAESNPPEPPFGSTADTVFDIITTTDPSTFLCLEYIGREARQIWDKRVDGEPVVNTYLFLARFSDGTTVRIALNPEFGSIAAARTEALRYVRPLGQLPTVLRRGVKRLSVHQGNEGFHAGTGQVIFYADKVSQRISENHLEESVFHEAVHATWDDQHRLATAWQAAQQRDGRFLTNYARNSPDREDLAESALFAYGLLHHPGRIPPVDSRVTAATIPHRIAYVRELLPPEQPVHAPPADAHQCRQPEADVGAP